MSEAHSARIRVAHQFESFGQQHEADTLGIWVFLVTEVMFFGGLFTGYAIYRSLYYPAFAASSRILDIRLGAINTWSCSPAASPWRWRFAPRRPPSAGALRSS